MTTPVVECGGRPLPIAERIGRGGEGEIYALADGSPRAVKLYLHPDADREAKVAAMITRRLSVGCTDVAFPLEMVRHSDGRFAGFTMRRVEAHQPIHELITPASRRDHFPSADYRFLVHVASNVARIVASVHAAGIVIGDINSAAFLVSQQGTVKLIDADSFQIGTHRCRVGMAEFTPGELQGVPFGAIDRTRDHDAFGLAVILFELLAFGRHPYAGIGRKPLPLEQAIVQGRFAYSLLRSVGATPPPAAPRLDDFPRHTRLLFERAFAPRGGARPTAAEWGAALGKMAGSLAPCPHFSSHFMPTDGAHCPWCRIEQETKRAIFPNAVAIPARRAAGIRSTVDERAAETIADAKRHAGEALMPMWSRQTPSPSKGARRALDSIGGKAARLPPAMRAYHFGREVLDKYCRRHDAAERAAVRALDAWRTRLGVWDVAKLTDRLRRSVDRFERIEADRPKAITHVAAQIATKMAVDLLAQESIETARIPGLGTALKNHLAAHGIVSAADISRPALAAIGGIGEARIVSLLFWAEALTIHAEERASTVNRDKVLDSATAALARYQQALRHQIHALCAEIDTRVARVRKAVWLVDRDLESALAARDQARVDLDHLGLTGLDLSSHFAIAAAKRPAPKPKKASKKRAKMACPKCRSAMTLRWGPPVSGRRSLFYGCTAYPRCTATVAFKGKKLTP